MKMRIGTEPAAPPVCSAGRWGGRGARASRRYGRDFPPELKHTPPVHSTGTRASFFSRATLLLHPARRPGTSAERRHGNARSGCRSGWLWKGRAEQVRSFHKHWRREIRERSQSEVRPCRVGCGGREVGQGRATARQRGSGPQRTKALARVVKARPSISAPVKMIKLGYLRCGFLIATPPPPPPPTPRERVVVLPARSVRSSPRCVACPDGSCQGDD